MALEFLEEHADFRNMLRKFGERELEPLAEEIDRTGVIPDIAIEKLRKQGLLGLRIDPKFGGAGASFTQYCIAQEEICRVHRAFMLMLDFSSGMAATALQNYGTPEQQAKYVRGVAEGRMKVGFGLTEPTAGSDPAGMRTKAVRVDGGWLLNGQKQFISEAHVADAVVIMAVTDPVKRARGGVTSLIVDTKTPGFQVTRLEGTMGSEVVKLSEITMTDCFVPDSMVLGEVGGGFKLAMSSLVYGRLGIAACSLGVADRLINMSIEHAKNRETFGQKLSERQAIQWMLVDSATELMAARAMTYETLRQLEEGREVGSAASMCKVFATEMVGRVADRAVQVHGAMGVVRGYKVERFFRDVRHWRVGEGTSEVQRILIARELFK